jgi:hypothetical protein
LQAVLLNASGSTNEDKNVEIQTYKQPSVDEEMNPARLIDSLPNKNEIADT